MCPRGLAVITVQCPLGRGRGEKEERRSGKEIHMPKEEERAARAEWQSETDRGSYSRKGEQIRCRRRDFI